MATPAHIVVLSTSLEANRLKLRCDFYQRPQKVLEQRLVGTVELCKVVLVHVRGEVRMGDLCANITHRLAQLLGGHGEVQRDKLDPWIFDQRLEWRSGCHNDLAPFFFRRVPRKVFDDRRAGDTISAGDESYFGSHVVWLGLKM